ncbi:MAG: M20/M25/M40 family metallo-hydrolase [Myxococcota bacterium]
MIGWDELLGRLAETPRENGTAALHETASFLVDALGRSGVDAELVRFTAQPYGLRLVGVVALVMGLLYFRLMRKGKRAAALILAVVVPVLLLAERDHYATIVGWIGAQPQYHVAARLPARAAVQRLVLTAHYDTKTDVLDHVQRAPIDYLTLPVVVLMVLGALAGIGAARFRRRARALERLGTAAAWAAALYGVGAFVALSVGAFLPSRSPGALDNGGSCAVLVRLAGALAEAPPLERTDVEVLLLSAEEVGVQGSWEYAAKRFASPPALPTFVVNLEGLGASTGHVVLGGERFTLRTFPPDPRLVALLDDVHRERFGEPVEVTAYAGATDARSFLAHGIPAATLMTREPGQRFTRGLHSARDVRSRLDPAALDASTAYLLDVVRAIDARGL